MNTERMNRELFIKETIEMLDMEEMSREHTRKLGWRLMFLDDHDWYWVKAPWLTQEQVVEEVKTAKENAKCED